VRAFAPRVSLGFPEALGDEIFDYRRCVLPSANGDRGRMSYERSDDGAVMGGHSIQARLLVNFHYRSNCVDGHLYSRGSLNWPSSSAQSCAHAFPSEPANTPIPRPGLSRVGALLESRFGAAFLSGTNPRAPNCLAAEERESFRE